MKNNLKLHDAHVLAQRFFLANDLSDIKPLTESRARQWLQRPTWSRHEAILILSGSDPESRRYYDVDGFKSLSSSANGAVDWLPAQTLKSVLPSGDDRPHGEYLDWANEEYLKWEGDNQVRYRRLTLPAALQAALAPATGTRVGQDATGLKQDKVANESNNWKMRIQVEAASRFKRLRASGASPTVHSIINDMAKWCRDNNVKTDGGIFPAPGYLRTHVLSRKHWSPPL